MATPVSLDSPMFSIANPVNAPPLLTIRTIIWQRIERLRHRDALIVGVQVTGMLGLATLIWGAHCCREKTSLMGPLVSSVVTACLSKFYGGTKGAIKVFTDYFPKALELTRSQMKPAPTAGPTGIWPGTGRDIRWSQFFDSGLADAMVDLLTGGNAYDFGCAANGYAKRLKENGIDCLGLDGNPAIEALSGGTAQMQDLALSFKREPRDCVISLEVGAKIPETYEDQFIENIDTHAKNRIILSWPIKGQKGPNQLNPQDNKYIISKFENLGWKLDEAATEKLRERSCPIFYWFRDTLMVFHRKKD